MTDTVIPEDLLERALYLWVVEARGSDLRDSMELVLRDVLRRSIKAEAIPAGWKLVPIEPDETQLEIAAAQVSGLTQAQAREIYVAAVEFAPDPPKGE